MFSIKLRRPMIVRSENENAGRLHIHRLSLLKVVSPLVPTNLKSILPVPRKRRKNVQSSDFYQLQIIIKYSILITSTILPALVPAH